MYYNVALNLYVDTTEKLYDESVTDESVMNLLWWKIELDIYNL